MLLKTVLEKGVCFTSSPINEVVLFEEGIQFTVVSIGVLNDNTIDCRLEDFSVDLEITEAKYRNGDGNIYDEKTKTFKCSLNKYITFSISTNIEFKEVDYVKVQHKLEFPYSRIELLDMFNYYPLDFELPGYEYLKFKSYIRKIKKGEVTLTIENPYDLRLNGKKGNFESISYGSYDINLWLTFIFDPRTVNKTAEEHSVIESRPDSVLSSATPKKQKNFVSKKYPLIDLLDIYIYMPI
uniref:Uncharacterized protein n=1 Tax=Panagrolaimus davidi TaxID=227884 RepID=A0A914PBA7_9BILA